MKKVIILSGLFLFSATVYAENKPLKTNEVKVCSDKERTAEYLAFAQSLLSCKGIIACINEQIKKKGECLK